MTLRVPAGYRVGPWEVGAPIAAGAFGSVYEGRRPDGASERHGEPGRVALKFLPTGTRTPRQLHYLQDLAEREIALLRTLRRPRLIRMYEVLTVDDPGLPELDGACVLTLERADTSLDRLLTGSGPVPVDRVALLAQICEGLAQLHGAGWVHGDLKRVRLCDFDLAAELEGTHAYSPAFSTPDYSPPELQWTEVGERGQRIRTTADIWALGVLAHLVLTGTFPFPGGTPSARRDAALGYAQGGEELRLSPELDGIWRDIVGDCLSRTHKERAPHTAPSLLRRAEAAGDGAAGRPRRSRRRRFQLAGLAGGVALALVTGTAAVTTALQDRTGSDGVEPAGYERCPRGYVCFFSKPQGQGDMCSWYGFDEDWRTGTISCPWSGRQAPLSAFNNGTNGKYTGVVYFRGDDKRGRAGCITRLSRHELPDAHQVRSHSWVKHC